ncbi:matrixin family metalloprotease [Hymenobacter rubripertinctus]|uniref:T9SS C-terminal target domain-containing protein n=1 Tax=Hymenobacter rubripertinctus TaxID=2029981 RepID=A0A418QXD6_9BACT|nr:matrixin family metalloprotease [Hymenobacter rubripertinctus]RIY09814.1 T9SS C-terminal target domain-containing protein [Hymenobacter rubripertinctus]
MATGTLALWGGLATLAQAQEACLLEPLPLARRVAAAPLIVEARVQVVRSQDEGPRIVTHHELEVFKVFRGTLPGGALVLTTEGGTVGLRREEVSNSPALAVGQQAVFLLEPDPAHPSHYRLSAGPQGLLLYDLNLAIAADPFHRYASIGGELYGALTQLTGQPVRVVQPNAALTARLNRVARPGATPVISSFSPTTVTAGTFTVLTINGSGFGATQGSGSVGFSNANNGGTSFVSPLGPDYLAWSDTQIRVRVPSATIGGSGAAGTGRLLITNGTAETSLSADNLQVDYALANVNSGNQPYRVAMVGRDGAGGYTLQYNTNFAANTAAKASFERSIATWRNGVGANRKSAPTTTAINLNASDGVNVVSFDDATDLPAGVLGTTYSYYSGCSTGGGPLNWVLTETDYIYDGQRNWQFGPAAPTGGQFDFETVSLHELGHGIQLGHIIKPGAVMHYAIGANSRNRVLNATNDVAGANAEIDFSLTAPRCGNMVYARLAPVPLPVTLVRFGAVRQGRQVVLSWETATELNSDFFAVETSATGTDDWQELARQPAAGTTSSARTYRYLDPRPPLAARQYYRLRQQDIDGSVHYSSVVVVARPNEMAGLSAYPNPFTHELTLRVPAPVAATVRLLSLTGQVVHTQVLPAGQLAPTLSTPALRPGVYLLEWRAPDGQTARTRVEKR